MARLVIRNEEDLAAALERADELMGCTTDSDEEREIAAIADAVETYLQSISVAGKASEGSPEGTGSHMEPEEPISNGRQLALRMQKAYPDQDWVALIADRSGEPRDKIEWHLQQEIAPTGAMLFAAGELLAEAHEEEAGEGEPPL